MNKDFEAWLSEPNRPSNPTLIEAYEAGRVRGFNCACEQIRNVDPEHPVLGELDFPLRKK